MSDHRFESIRSLVNRACDEAREADIKGAINWADLHCADVIRCEREAEVEFWRVVVEEAEPDNRALCDYVENFLKERGYTLVEVQTEW